LRQISSLSSLAFEEALVLTGLWRAPVWRLTVSPDCRRFRRVPEPDLGFVRLRLRRSVGAGVAPLATCSVIVTTLWDTIYHVLFICGPPLLSVSSILLSGSWRAMCIYRVYRISFVWRDESRLFEDPMARPCQEQDWIRSTSHIACSLHSASNPATSSPIPVHLVLRTQPVGRQSFTMFSNLLTFNHRDCMRNAQTVFFHSRKNKCDCLSLLWNCAMR
jgi:hypothetical protein